MSYSTYVYAIVGVYCKDVRLSVTKTRERGCDHLEGCTPFCPICGKPTWVEQKIEHHASDKLEHLQEWYGSEDNEFDETAISMIYSQMTGPTEFVIGRVLESMDAGAGDSVTFNTLSGEEYTAAYEQTKSALEPLGLWDATKFGYMLYSISM